MPVNTELCDRKYWSRNDCYLWVTFSSPSTQFLLLILPFFTQFYKSQENDILSSDRLERHIANITPLDRWLATIRNRPLQLAELSHSKFDPKLFSHVPYVNFLWYSQQKCCFQHFATKWDNFRYRKWIEREEIKRKWENVESEPLSIYSFALHFLFIFSFSFHFLAASLPQFVQLYFNGIRRESYCWMANWP